MQHSSRRAPRGNLAAARSLVVVAASLAAPPAARAALELPRPSPLARVTQTVGLTEITVEYSSPAVKGRTVWGALVPYDQLWRTGANAATKVTFSRDVTVGERPVPSGTYSLFFQPGRGEWTAVLNRNAALSGTRGYKQEDDVARFTVKPVAIPHRERMTFVFADFTDDKVSLDLEWEKVKVSIPITTRTGEHALANIQKATDEAWRAYANAARYLLEEKKDFDAGLGYVDKSLSLKEDWYNAWIKASILAAKGRHKDAYPWAEKAMDLGKKAEFFFFEEEVRKALADWKTKK